MSKPITCPLCESGHMELKEVQTDRPNGREGKSYLWICEECPGILLEWWDSQDTESFNKYMGYTNPELKKIVPFADIYKEFQALDAKLDSLENDIKAILPGPETENSNWVYKAKTSKKESVKTLFKMYQELYEKHVDMFHKDYAEVKKQ